MKRLLPFILIIAALILAACAGARAPMEAPAEPAYDVAPLPAMEEGFAAEQAPSSGGGGVEAANVERLVIQNADLAIVVSDVEGRMEEIQKMAEEMGGFVVSSNLYQGYTSTYIPVPEGTVTIRVPAEKLDEALELIKEGAVEVQSETRSGQDVTAEYVDLKSRLKTYEAAERELTELMENAQDTDEVVNIFNQLMYYREQIEIIKGQIQYYEEAAALSAVSVRLIAEETIQPVTIGKWEPKGVALEAIQDLLNFWKNFVDFMIRFILYTLPVLVTIGIPLYLAFLGLRWVFRKMRGNKKKAEPQQAEEKK
ncbi:MAG: hypothetical protein JETCAE01_07230 [Anaerolineaceae bacterium]|nr:MAG: DUF4349 domain-containing protein [Chloroflexota bacterium]MCE7859874.1 DUF4349 domain-containing protein [Chloroflexi bacterium CFX2]GJQ34713.1 MAG: hypothetical protein JETCAE01_07230 [Anaerolineaceae bacterium]